MRWRTVEIDACEGPQQAVAPEVISASRSTDIPAFHAEWFMRRLREGYVKWINPFNQKATYVSFDRTRAVVFWSKNPRPIMRYLGEIEERGIGYYFQFTVNDYEAEKLEPNVPPLADRIATFQELAKRVGKERVIWRFDPLILAAGLGVHLLLEKIEKVGNDLHGYTDKLVFSFADISDYAKVRSNLKRLGIGYSDFSEDQMLEAARGISELCRKWGIKAATCGEKVELTDLGIEHNKCVDDDLLLAITHNDPDLMQLFGRDGQLGLLETEKAEGPKIKDPGQRAECLCVFSKDIGQYNTCRHLCVYCYANTSQKVVERNAAACRPDSEAIVAD